MHTTIKEDRTELVTESLQSLSLFLIPILLILPLYVFNVLSDIQIVYYVIYSIYIIGTFSLVKYNNKKLADIGISKEKFVESLFYSCLFVSIFIVITAVRAGMHVSPELTPSQIIGQVIYNFVFSGFAQEILFRGLIFFSLWRWKGWKTALVVSSVLFGLVHLGKGLNYVFTTAIIGAVYGYITYQTKNIGGPIVAHGVHNFVLGFILVL